MGEATAVETKQRDPRLETAKRGAPQVWCFERRDAEHANVDTAVGHPPVLPELTAGDGLLCKDQFLSRLSSKSLAAHSLFPSHKVKNISQSIDPLH